MVWWRRWTTDLKVVGSILGKYRKKYLFNCLGWGGLYLEIGRGTMGEGLGWDQKSGTP